MTWVNRLKKIREELAYLLEEATTDDQRAAARSIMTCVDAWRHVDGLAAKEKHPKPHAGD